MNPSRPARIGLVALAALGCGGSASVGDDTTDGGPVAVDARVIVADPQPDAALPPFTLADGCPDLFDQTLLPSFELTVAPGEWKKLVRDWDSNAGRLTYDPDVDPDIHPEHMLAEFRYGTEIVTNATIRVRGNPRWWTKGGKMQFEISFNTVDPKGRFHSLRNIVLDAAKQNASFLRERLALAVMRDMGVPAACANNARLVVNGEYYGLYTNIQKIDKEFLQRHFVDDEGNLYKRHHWILKTNEALPDTSDLDQLLAIHNVTDLAAVMDLHEAALEFASEALIPNADGTFAGAMNFYVYHEGTRGWIIIPWDLDATFERLPANTDPLRWHKPPPLGERPWFDLLVGDPTWRAAYVAALERGMMAYDTGTLQQRVDDWSAQVATAAKDDPNKPFTAAAWQAEVTELRAYVAERRVYLEKWLSNPPGE